MKKFLIASLFVTIAFSSHLQARLVHEWTVDLYYANGVLASSEQSSKATWDDYSRELKSKYPSLKQALKFGEAKLSYNASYLWGLSDLTEVILQYRAEHPAAEITWQLLSKFVEKRLKYDWAQLIEYLGTITSEATLAEQSEAYRQSVKNGHGVIAEHTGSSLYYLLKYVIMVYGKKKTNGKYRVFSFPSSRWECIHHSNKPKPAIIHTWEEVVTRYMSQHIRTL